jgi:hypothetical protein
MAREFSSFGVLATHFRAVADRLPHAIQDALGESAELVEATAKAGIAAHETPKGPYQGWGVRAGSPLIEKRGSGWAPCAPLLPTGELHDSIRREVEECVGGNVFQAVVGSKSPVMPCHEYGTSKMPGRPVLGQALFVNIENSGKILIGRFQKIF